MNLKSLSVLLILVVSPETPVAAQSKPALTVEVVKVESRRLDKTVALPGDLMPYQSVAIYAKVSGFLESILVDRGSVVEKDEPLATITAPELLAQRAEAEARVQTIEAQRSEAQARLQAIQSTYQRLKAASATPGVVAGNDVEVAENNVAADRARVVSLENSLKSAQAAVKVIEELFSYLRLTAPFDGVVTERNAHPGALVGPSAGPNNPPIVRIEQTSRLRLVVPVPEAQIAGIALGTRVTFTVPAYPNENFQGIVRRSSQSLDLKTRTMLVELDVNNPNRRLAPGMFADVTWTLRRPQASLFVPTSAVVTTTERSFVIRVNNGVAEWVDVKRGTQVGTTIEVFGNLKEGDVIVRRGTDEIRAGTPVVPQAQTSSAK